MNHYKQYIHRNENIQTNRKYNNEANQTKNGKNDNKFLKKNIYNKYIMNTKY